jgi:hypothetical protein
VLTKERELALHNPRIVDVVRVEDRDVLAAALPHAAVHRPIPAERLVVAEVAHAIIACPAGDVGRAIRRRVVADDHFDRRVRLGAHRREGVTEEALGVVCRYDDRDEGRCLGHASV